MQTDKTAKTEAGTEALDFLVRNTCTGNVCAAFLLPRDALHYIKWRGESEGPHGPSYEIKNKDGSPISPVLAAQVEAVGAMAKREHTRLNPRWGDAPAA